MLVSVFHLAILSVIYQCWEPIHSLLPKLQLLTHQQAVMGCDSQACCCNYNFSIATLPTRSPLNLAGLGTMVSLGQDVVFWGLPTPAVLTYICCLGCS